MRYRLFLVATALLLGGCAALPPGKRDARDPFERANRAVFQFNYAADKALFRPAARAWEGVVPIMVRDRLGNFVSNLGYTTTVVNDFLQGKGADGASDVARLVVNTVGGLGFFDPASRIGLARHSEDFGQTLGHWGFPSGPYLMLPLLGPSTVRDAPGLLVDEYTNARHYLGNSRLRWSLWLTKNLETRALLLPADRLIDQSYDPYVLTRNAWLQRRAYQMSRGDGDSGPGGAPATPGAEAAPADDSPPLEEPPDEPEATPGPGPAPAPGAAPPR